MFLEERAVSDYRKTPGDKDLVCEQLATAIRYPSPLSYGRLKLLPFWDPLRGDPRFESIVASIAPKETPNVIR